MSHRRLWSACMEGLTVSRLPGMAPSLLYTAHVLFQMAGPRYLVDAQLWICRALSELPWIVGFRRYFRSSVGGTLWYYRRARCQCRVLMPDCLEYHEFFQHAVDELVAKGMLDGERVAVFGASHGGFLACHLTAQFPVGERHPSSLNLQEFQDRYRAAIALNSVQDMMSMLDSYWPSILDVSAMFTSSDISDWAVYEATGKNSNFGEMLSEDDLRKMHNSSPLARVGEVAVVYRQAESIGRISGDIAEFAAHRGEGYSSAPALQAVDAQFAVACKNLPVCKGLWCSRLVAVLFRVNCYPDSKHSLNEVNVQADVQSTLSAGWKLILMCSPRLIAVFRFRIVSPAAARQRHR